MPHQDSPYFADPAAVGNVGLLLCAHLMAHLLRKKLLTIQDVGAIFQETRVRYTTLPQAQVPGDDWEKQTTAILSLIHNDVLQFGVPS